MVPPKKLSQWESAIDTQIREAQERGDFDNLPGQGRPLPADVWDDEWGDFTLGELEGYKGRFGLGIERDRYWTEKPFSEAKRELYRSLAQNERAG